MGIRTQRCVLTQVFRIVCVGAVYIKTLLYKFLDFKLLLLEPLFLNVASSTAWYFPSEDIYNESSEMSVALAYTERLLV